MFASTIPSGSVATTPRSSSSGKSEAHSMSTKVRVTIWNEFRHERKNEAVKKVYPEGMHVAIAKGLASAKDLVCRTATLEEPEHGLTEAVLKETDVLVWWGHVA